MIHSSQTGGEFARQYLRAPRESALRLSRPQALTKDSGLATALTELLCNWSLDPQYTRLITHYIRTTLPKDAHVRVIHYLKRLRREGFLVREEGLSYVAERKAIIALVFALGDQLKTYAPNPDLPTAPEDAANALLQLAGYDRLYARSLEDASVIFSLNNQIDMARWQAELKPICDAHQSLCQPQELLTLGDLRRHIRAQETQEGLTADLTGLAHQDVGALRGGPAVFATWLDDLETSLFSFVRERARLYLCRALLSTLDRQVQDFLSYRDAALSRLDPLYGKLLPYDRESVAAQAEKLWLKGQPAEAPPPFQSEKGILHLSAVLQNRERTTALIAEDFDCLKLNFTQICREMCSFYCCSGDDDGALGIPCSAFTGNRLKQILGGQLPVSRTLLIRALVFLGGKNSSFVDNRLVRAGFAPLDQERNLDDALMCAL